MFTNNKPLRPTESQLILQAQFEGLSISQLQARDAVVEANYMNRDEATVFVQKIGGAASQELFDLFQYGSVSIVDLIEQKFVHAGPLVAQ